MPRIPEQTLTAIGRMTVAATELEHVLAWIGADQAGGDAAAVFARPGEPLRAARGSVQFAALAHREEFIRHVEGAATQLARSQSALRALWREDTRVDPAVFDEIATFLLRCRDNLQALVATRLGAAGR
ncbi:hypothetical protein ACFFWC_13840 [Plantactinospora siamensis]|uniref:Uncharacterized protein n=1 Tax=Plantactinospora siamensis TaxID=555372 RepID=A0ABV6P2I3_9ACTN